MTDISSRCGAEPAEWARVFSIPELAPWVLPVECNPETPLSPKSSIKAAGKLPSVKNAAGQLVGIPGWTTAPETDIQQLDTWSRDPDAGFCVRTGHDGLIAIDADIDDPETAREVMTLFCSAAGIDPAGFAYRHRGNSRWAALCQLTDRGVMQKTVIHLGAPGGDMVEILGAGQQLVCAGWHPKGQRYTWTGEGITCYQITPDALQNFTTALSALYGGETVAARNKSPRQKAPSYAAPDRLADWLRSSGRVIKTGTGGELYIPCPWCGNHSRNSGDTETAYFPAGSNGYPHGGFRCLHAHCTDKGLPEFAAWARGRGYTETAPGDYPDETASPDAPGLPGIPEAQQPSTSDRLLLWTNEKSGYIESCISAVRIALSDPVFCGWELAFDTFQGKVVIRQHGEREWRLYTEDHTTELRVELESQNFKPGKIGKDLVNDAVKLIARDNHVDTMRDFLTRTLPKWDGTPRAETFLSRYCGAEDSEYTRAVGRYFWGMLWRRAISPEPIKADISLVLIGPQGANKTRFIKMLALAPEYHTELNFNLSAAELAMRMGGRVLAEFPEMVGFGKRKLEEIKAFLTLETDTYRPLYSSDQRTVTRRSLFIMTTNNGSFLSDRTGNRRYAPVEVSNFDADAALPDIPQLWAEGEHIFKALGGLQLHRDVEALTETINENYVLPDAWETAISEWLAGQECAAPDARYPLQNRNILKYALGFTDSAIQRDDLSRVSEIMQNLGYRYKAVRTPSGNIKMWCKSHI